MNGLVDTYGWHALLTPELLVVALAAALLYAKAGHFEKYGNGEQVILRSRKQAAFYAGILCMYLGYGGVLSALARQSIDVYVLQLCIRYMCMVPLLIAGMPEWVRNGFLRKLPGGKKLLAFGGPNIPALLVFVAMLTLLMWPQSYQDLNRVELLRFPLHLVLLYSGWFMWEGVLRPRTSWRQRGNCAARIFVIGGVMLLPLCVSMNGAHYTISSFRGASETQLCGAPQVDWITTPYLVGSTSVLGGILLMGALQLSLAIAVIGMRRCVA
ncbi:cytochrome c oxidase assembly protein [Cohnella sp. LGH]|uniref:cytochrome c oxidase assembly protein n=1 Tax=Cohnella sp. LGH TaxID=1619153 RepID=UPI001ADC0CF9|nr:cytochrome c oxidase assembly protein [Cohnella sp. LGH]QTH45478.1 cytochrome c oxidase assembly protein [Cohnella sp. LGH]